MKNKSKRTAMRNVAVCGCLCLLAVGVGVVWQDVDSKRSMPNASQSNTTNNAIDEVDLQPVALSKTPTVDETKLQKAKQSNDPAVLPKADTTPAPKATESGKPVFSYPVQGEFVMPYSVDSAIYDPTLDQYHTNNSLSISAQTGTPVKAAEKGTVKEITKDEENGNRVSIEHEGGWLTTYSQLADEISVKVGEAVTKGQALGTVGEPTMYTVALGSHVEFAVEKDGETVDPETVVEK